MAKGMIISFGTLAIAGLTLVSIALAQSPSPTSSPRPTSSPSASPTTVPQAPATGHAQ